jgi:flagellar biosynthesis protein FliP
MTMFLLSLFLGVSFVSLVHFIVEPLVKRLWRKYEPKLFHFDYKLRKKREKTLRRLRVFLNKKVKEKSLKSYLFLRSFWSRICHGTRHGK